MIFLPAPGILKPLDRPYINGLLARMNTEPLRRPDAATVVLVVLNTGGIPAPPCRVRFAATFPTTSPKPVTVRDDRGSVVPSCIARETITTRATDLPVGKIRWSIVLEFAVPDGLPPYTARAFATSYEQSPSLPALHLPLRDDLPVYETTCHPGDLPTILSLRIVDMAS